MPSRSVFNLCFASSEVIHDQVLHLAKDFFVRCFVHLPFARARV
jgi:hypothetical protein